MGRADGPRSRSRTRRLRLACALGVVGLIGIVAVATPAHAQLGATIAVESDYRYRGVSLSDSRPRERLTLNYDAPRDWYAGASLTRATLAFLDTYVQATGYAGWVTRAENGRSFELGVQATHFAGVSGYDFAELYAGVLAERWSARAYLSPDYYGRHVRAGYAELDAHRPFGASARVFAHAGVLVPLGGGEGDARRARLDVSAGAGYVVGGWDLHLSAVVATRRGPYPAVYSGRRAAIVVGASWSL